MHINDILNKAAEESASDLHLAVGIPPTIRVDGDLKPLYEWRVSTNDTKAYSQSLLSGAQLKILAEKGQVDFAYKSPRGLVYRVNAFRYSDQIGFACRILIDNIPTAKELGLPDFIDHVADLQSGLVLVTGPTGCGKSTTIASIIDAINKKKSCHILTIEDPIEYIHKNIKSIITQREVGRDCINFADALRAGLRQDPDVIMVGEMRDLETISTAITAAETGHLVLATLHTRNAHQTIERIIDVFPAQHQQQIRVQLASSLMAVFSQRLVPRRGDVGRIASVESLILTPAVRNLIRENKVHQMYSFMQTGQKIGMQTMDQYLLHLYNNRMIARGTLIENAVDQEYILKQIN